MQKVCYDFNEFSDILDKLGKHEYVVVSADEGTIRRLVMN
jgi:bisphosphoglycerate-dependent phosphoglycerate mutase